MTQRTKKLEIGRTKIATVRAKYKGVSGNFDVYYGNICVPYVDGKMMILPKEKYLSLLKTFLKNEGVEYIAPTLEEASTIADRVWAKYEETSRRKKEEESLRAEAIKNDEKEQAGQAKEDQTVNDGSEDTSLKENVSDEENLNEEKPAAEEQEVPEPEESANHAHEPEESKREEEITEEVDQDNEKIKEESNFVDTMSTKIPEDEKPEEGEEEQNSEEEEIIILDCEAETRFESKGEDEPIEIPEKQSVEDTKEEKASISGIEETDLFSEKQGVSDNFDDADQEGDKEEDSDFVDTMSTKLEDETSPEHPMSPEVSEELINELKRMIREQHELVLNDQALILRKIEGNSEKLEELLQEDKSVELNFDLNGLEKEFKKMNRKISAMKWVCLLSLAVSIALGSVAAYFGLGYGDTLLLRSGEEVELHAVIHGEEGDRYSLLGTLSIDDNGEIIIE